MQTETDPNLSRAIAPVRHGPRERIGGAIGRTIAPAIARIRRFRRAHASAAMFAGRSEAIVGGAYASVGAQLEGRALVQIGRRHVALRIRPGQGPELDEHPALADQDLLFASANRRHYSITPFAVHDHDHISLRLEPIDRALCWLEARKTWRWDWHAIARITIEHSVELDDDALHFDPERTGCGLVPVGLVDAIRRGAIM